jgi:hypothetical protein
MYGMWATSAVWKNWRAVLGARGWRIAARDVADRREARD